MGSETENLKKLLGMVPSPPDSRDYPLSALLDQPLAEIILPSYKYPGYSTKFPVYTQVGPSCVGNGSALAASIDQKRDHRHWDTYDGEELYARCKEQDGIPGIDGTYPRIAHKIRQDRGVKIKASPNDAEKGKFSKIRAYARLMTIREIKIAIYEWGSAGFGSTWYNEWFSVDAKGFVTKGIVPAGGHYYDAIGWSNMRDAFLCQNSWGSHWGTRFNGTGGRFWLRFEYVDFDDLEAWRTVDVDEDR